MKTFKILFAAVIIAGFATSAIAQPDQTDNASAAARAMILSAISVDHAADIEFGQVVPGTTPNLIANSVISNSTDVGATAQFGRINVSGAPGASVKITYTEEVEMSNGTHVLYYNPSVYRTNGAGDTQGSIEVSHDSNYNIDSTNGIDYLFIGGTLNEEGTDDQPIPTGISGGEYTGTFVLTAEYN